MTRRPGFSIVELLVVAAIIALLLAITLPLLSMVGGRAKTGQTLARLRDHAAAIAADAGDRDNLLPWPGPATDGLVRAPDDSSYPYFQFCYRWTADLRARGALPGDSTACLDSPYAAEPTGLSYLLPCAVFTLPEFWNASTREGPHQWRPVRLDDVRTASAKCIVVDNAAWAASIDHPDRTIPGFHAAYADGSAEALPAALPGHPTGDGPFAGTLHLNDVGRGLHTVDGIRGRDR